MVAVPARLPVITPPSDTVTYFAFEVENFRPASLPAGSHSTTGAQLSPTPRVREVATKRTPVGAPTYV